MCVYVCVELQRFECHWYRFQLLHLLAHLLTSIMVSSFNTASSMVVVHRHRRRVCQNTLLLLFLLLLCRIIISVQKVLSNQSMQLKNVPLPWLHSAFSCVYVGEMMVKDTGFKSFLGEGFTKKYWRLLENDNQLHIFDTEAVLTHSLTHSLNHSHDMVCLFCRHRRNRPRSIE
jgi:hypothetical protein